MKPSSLEKEIDDRIGEVRTDTFDLSFGEIANLHQNGELIIAPEYQRLFRWSPHQRSHLVESLLLDLPVPQIFVVENDNGVLELIDGLQRVSSVLQFIVPASVKLDPLVLEGCTLITGLNGLSFEQLPLSLKLRLKRSPVRTVVIKRQSQSFLRYELFKRLNTGGSMLEPQEIRNCSSRMFGESGIRFYTFLVELAASADFKACAAFLPQPEIEKKGDEELVLRFFALKNSEGSFSGSVRDWLDQYMEQILKSPGTFDYDVERQAFLRVFELARQKLGDEAFLRHRNGQPTGSLAPAYFEAIAIAIHNQHQRCASKEAAALRASVTKAIGSQEFREVTGPGANSKQKLRRRIECIEKAIADA